MSALEDWRKLATGEPIAFGPEAHPQWLKREMDTPNWTTSAEGRENSSPEFTALVAEVDRLIREGGGWSLDPAWTRMKAGLIMAQLAHVHKLAPVLPE